MAFDGRPTEWWLHLTAGAALCLATGCQGALDPHCQSGASCSTDARNMQKWTIGEDAVFSPPCRPDCDFHGYRATSWREWPASGADWRDQTSLYPSASFSEYSDWQPDHYEILDMPTRAVEEPTGAHPLDHAEDLPGNEPVDEPLDKPSQDPVNDLPPFDDFPPIDDLPPFDAPTDIPPPTPDDIAPAYDDQSSIEFREPPPEDEQLGDPPLPVLSD